MKAFFWSSLLLGLCLALPAQAQYANRSLGIGLGGMSFSAGDAESIRWGIPMSLEGALYIENGWDVGVQIPMLILFDTVSKRQYFTLGASFSFRYLFSEEHIRPYLGGQVGVIYIFRNDASLFGGIGPIGGVDFFVADSVSIGPRLFANFYLALNERVRMSFGGVLATHVYF